MVSICAVPVCIVFCEYSISCSVNDIFIGAVCHGQFPDALLCKNRKHTGAFQRMDMTEGCKTQAVSKTHGGSFLDVCHRSRVREEPVENQPVLMVCPGDFH